MSTQDRIELVKLRVSLARCAQAAGLPLHHLGINDECDIGDIAMSAETLEHGWNANQRTRMEGSGMSIFGWSYPPGCSGPPDDTEFPCAVCGNFADDCICPECPVCGAQGYDFCYKGHGMVRSEAQEYSLAWNEAHWEDDARQESAAWIEEHPCRT